MSTLWPRFMILAGVGRADPWGRPPDRVTAGTGVGCETRCPISDCETGSLTGRATLISSAPPASSRDRLPRGRRRPKVICAKFAESEEIRHGRGFVTQEREPPSVSFVDDVRPSPPGFQTYYSQLHVGWGAARRGVDVEARVRHFWVGRPREFPLPPIIYLARVIRVMEFA